MREGKPNMSIEQIKDKIVAHNYGHGGSGWTLAPGAAAYVNDLLVQEMDKANQDQATPITIIGAGALGLFTAHDLIDKGYHNVTVVAENFESLTSHNAGGILAPVSMSNAPEMQGLIDKIGIDAYKFYMTIINKTHPLIKEGAIKVPTYFQNREDSGLEPYVGVVMEPAKDVILDFGNGTQQPMVAYDDGIFMNTPGLMKSLRQTLEGRVKFEQRKIKSFDEIDTPVIINCSGLGAKDLNNDQEMVSVQDHLIMLKDQNPADMHMILVYFGDDKTASGQDVTRSFYYFPKQLWGSKPQDIGVIGGTFIKNADASTPDNIEFDIMMNGARKFYGLLK